MICQIDIWTTESEDKISICTFGAGWSVWVDDLTKCIYKGGTFEECKAIVETKIGETF